MLDVQLCDGFDRTAGFRDTHNPARVGGKLYWTRLAFTPLWRPVYVRRLDDLESQPLEVSKSPGFRGAPMFSPDGASLSYIEGNSIFS
jgi:hypothetical protein